jgi:hypothetical protein
MSCSTSSWQNCWRILLKCSKKSFSTKTVTFSSAEGIFSSGLGWKHSCGRKNLEVTFHSLPLSLSPSRRCGRKIYFGLSPSLSLSIKILSFHQSVLYIKRTESEMLHLVVKMQWGRARNIRHKTRSVFWLNRVTKVFFLALSNPLFVAFLLPLTFVPLSSFPFFSFLTPLSAIPSLYESDLKI